MLLNRLRKELNTYLRKSYFLSKKFEKYMEEIIINIYNEKC